MNTGVCTTPCWRVRRARRAALHCRENLAYARRILLVLQPRYASWGASWGPVWQPAQQQVRQVRP